jgi:subtilisin family serine protease
MGSKLHGVDPRLQNLVDGVTPPFKNVEEVSALVLAHGRLDEKHFENLLSRNGALHIVRLTEHIWSVRVDPKSLSDMAHLAEVAYVEPAKVLFPMLTRSVPCIKARREDVGEGVDGRNVVIGIVDYGIDWTLPDFCDETGATRIKFLWDQSLKPLERERSPDGFGHGVEYTDKDIDDALDSWGQGDRDKARSIVRHRPWPKSGVKENDTDGHGTHVAGIACGNGASRTPHCGNCYHSVFSGEYIGVAPKAWIVFVHLARKQMLKHISKADRSLGNSAELAEAIAYCYRKADELSHDLTQKLCKPVRVPCVVNLSMGFNGGSHDGESLVERVIDTHLEGRGRALAVAAGNQRQQRTYFGATVPPCGQPYNLGWNMGFGTLQDDTLNEMEIWYPSDRSLNARLISNHGARSEIVRPGQRVTLEFGAITGVIDSERFTPLNGDARIYIQVSPGPQDKLEGSWTVELTADCPPRAQDRNPVPFDAWIEKEAGLRFVEDDYRQSKFASNLPNRQRVINLTIPGTARRSITVGAVSKLSTSGEYQYSGTGPTRDGRLKPELVAPGIDICSNTVCFDRSDPPCTQEQMSGTSMAAPHVAGVIALMFQLNPGLTADQVKQILIASATHRGERRGFDPLWGFGVLNAHKALELARQTL